MQRRWEEQLAGYVAREFPRRDLAAIREPIRPISSSKLVTAAMLYFGAKLVISGDLTVGNSSPSTCWQGGSSSPCYAWLRSGRTFIRLDFPFTARRYSHTPRRSRPFSPGRAALPASAATSSFEHVTFRYRVDGVGGAARCEFCVRRRGRSSASLGHRALARARSLSSCSASTCQKAGAFSSMALICASSTHPGCVGRQRRAARERALQPFHT